MRSPGQPARSLVQRLAVVFAVVVQVGATFLPDLGLGEEIGDRSASVRTLITPSGWAFAIWGPLFLGSAAFALWQALPAQRDNPLLARIAWPAAVALAAQGVWALYTQFANLTFVSALIILVSLAGLLACLRALSAAERLSAGERWFAALVLSALAAWLTAASIVNISASLVYHGIGGGSANPLAAAAMVGVGGLVAALAVARSRGNPWYALVFCWALAAIHARGGQEAESIAIACFASGALVLAAALFGLARPANRRHWLGV
ncbi:hypothetical protein [Erythrobacter sp. HL-111]|uniref:hypothetical protein n=1 Tax=Erythrobacter sp. HL-111 TaxID=1798193 RepID=UPI0006D9BEC1|nr:hypothetical protein [Erythrobacter sp. HL-111]KPP91255.1 MAG: Acyltransferase family [Erythrobacteraceae bacterium HL-111]SDT07991.1 hypothetical protein SAMN04515621_2864 [Erythrobacter sp. HL-111]